MMKIQQVHVRFYCSSTTGYFGRRDDAECVHDPVGIFLTDFTYEPGAHRQYRVRHSLINKTGMSTPNGRDYYLMLQQLSYDTRHKNLKQTEKRMDSSNIVTLEWLHGQSLLT